MRIIQEGVTLENFAELTTATRAVQGTFGEDNGLLHTRPADDEGTALLTLNDVRETATDEGRYGRPISYPYGGELGGMLLKAIKRVARQDAKGWDGANARDMLAHCAVDGRFAGVRCLFGGRLLKLL